MACLWLEKSSSDGKVHIELTCSKTDLSSTHSYNYIRTDVLPRDLRKHLVAMEYHAMQILRGMDIQLIIAFISLVVIIIHKMRF